MSRADILLTIVTPTFNLIKSRREETFRQCAESVARQSCRDRIEHIVVDGGSQDGTYDFLRKSANQFGFSLKCKTDNSIYEGMNNGLHDASGEYVLFLNSDDYFHNTNGLERALEQVMELGADYAFGDVHVVSCDGMYRRTWIGSTAGLPFATHYCHQSMMVKASVLKSYGGFQLKYRVSSDSDLMLHLFRDGRTYVHYDDVFVSYREGGFAGQHEQQAICDHATAFMEYFGDELGLTLEECCAMWCFSGLAQLSRQHRRKVYDKLKNPDWQYAWQSAIRARTLFSRLSNRWRVDGAKGLLGALVRRMSKILMPH